MDSESSVKPLYFYGDVPQEAREALRKGKELLGVDWFIQPTEVVFDAPEAGVVMCFEEPFFCFLNGYVLLTKPYTPERMAAALKEIYGITDGRYITTASDWLSEAFGAKVKLIIEEES
jgi:hypothetical protein